MFVAQLSHVQGIILSVHLRSSTLAVGDLSASTVRVAREEVTEQQSEALVELVKLTIDTAIEYLNIGGMLVPMVLTERQGIVVGPEVKLFGDPMSIGTNFDLGLRQARRFVDGLAGDVERYVWVYDGYAGIGTRHSDAIVMEAAERSAGHAWQLTVRYRLSKTGMSLLDHQVICSRAVAVPLCGLPV
jgi:hypothetical protein